jgi:hypothetical protein
MPKLLLFAPCEKVLVDEATHTTSLIVVLQEIHYKLPPGTPALQPNAALPLQWSIVSLWQEEDPADAGVEFEQRIVLENNAGVALVTTDVKWKFTRPNHRIVANVPGLPLGSRKLLIKLSYRVPPSRDWIEAASFPLEVFQDVV